MSESHKKNLFAGLSKTLYQSELHKMHELHTAQSFIIPVPPCGNWNTGNWNIGYEKTFNF